MYDYLIVGAGFSGAALAERLSRNLKCRMLVIDARNHIGGNCRTERDESTGVMIHKYGPHIFHTDKKEIWDYVNQFDRFMPFINRVKAVHNGEVYSLPVNLHTINQFFRRSFTPGEAQEFIRSLSAKDIAEPKNFEEQALKFIGRELYESFFYGYTKKQWGCEPRELPASILKRLPVRFNYNDNYYDHPYQGIPQNGYTYVIEKMLAQPQVEVRLNTPFNPNEHVQKFRHIFFTGALDSFFNFKYGRLSYRTIFFERHEAAGDYQGNAVINYVDETVPFTRIHEHKHFAPWEQHERTVYFKEFSKETGTDDEPYYPKRLTQDKLLLQKYRQEAGALNGISFLGRLATYRYMDMHHVIGEALGFSEKFVEAVRANVKPPVFPNDEH